MEVSCNKCQAVTTADVPFQATYFSCPSCRSLFNLEQGKPLFERAFTDKSHVDGMLVGQKGTLDGVEYTVTGIVVKKVYGNYYWREYIIVDQQANFRYLSESEGHWILLKDIDDAPDDARHAKMLEYDGNEFDLYDYTKADIVTALGFFDFRLQQEKIPMADYIHPPFMLSYESMNGEKSAFIGEHISKRKLGRAFKDAYLPYQSGVGVVSPPFADARNMAIIFCSVAVLLFVTHGFIYNGRGEQKVVDATIPFNSTSFVSPSFELKGGSAPLSILAYSNVDNSWASVDVALVNERTGDEEYATKDIEYYHGYTDGENWTEGNTSEKFSICGVPAGKYHIVATPQKAPEATVTGMTITATWEQPSQRNAFLMVFLMAFLAFCIYKYNIYREKQRWADSDNSPFNA